MIDNKKIAKYALSFMNGKPQVFAYHNDDNTKTIDIMTCEYDDQNDTSLSTIGLSNVDIGYVVDELPLRVEIAMAGISNDESFANILASTAFTIQDLKDCKFGMVIENVIIEDYVKNTELKHVLLLHPVFWEKYEKLVENDEIVAWLMAIPITDSEKEFIKKESVEKFDKLLEEKRVDITDLHRKSCV